MKTIATFPRWRSVGVRRFITWLEPQTKHKSRALTCFLESRIEIPPKLPAPQGLSTRHPGRASRFCIFLHRPDLEVRGQWTEDADEPTMAPWLQFRDQHAPKAFSGGNRTHDSRSRLGVAMRQSATALSSNSKPWSEPSSMKVWKTYLIHSVIEKCGESKVLRCRPLNASPTPELKCHS